MVASALLWLVGVLLAGCSSGGGSVITTPARSASTSAASSSTAAPSTATPAPGTVVPFRTAAAGTAAGKRFGLVSPAGSDPFGKAVTDSVIAQVDAAGADLIRCDPGDDEALLLDCARRMATQQVDGWIVVQPGDLGEALCEAGPSGVPLIVVAAAPVSCQTAAVGADDRRAGFLVGTALGEIARTRSHCVPDAFLIATNSEADVVSAQRVDGIRTGYASICPGSLTKGLVMDAGTQDRAYQAFTTATTALPDDAEILVAAVNDGAALGIAAAIPDARTQHVSLAGIGADQRARCEIRANPSWIGDAALFPDRYGEVVVPALLDATESRRIPQSMYIQTTFVTADTLDRFYDVGDCPGP